MDRTKKGISPDGPEEQIRNSIVFNPWSYATIISPPLLAGSRAPWRYGSSNMAYNGKNNAIWPKWPTLMIPYLHGHGEDPFNQRCYRHMGLRSQYMPLANPYGRL